MPLRIDRDKCLSEGMDFYLSKPFRPRELANVIERFLPARSQLSIDKCQLNESEPEIHADVVAEVETMSGISCNIKDKENCRDNGNESKHILNFDRDAFLLMIENNMELYHTMISVFLRRVPEILSDLHIGIENKDMKKISFNAHSLKGLSLTIRAGILSELSNNIDYKARNDVNIYEIKRLFVSLESAFKDFCEEVNKT